ncbi:MAG: NAD(P)H-dependent flavin oxidoreductase [Actinomycetota bacterium]
MPWSSRFCDLVGCTLPVQLAGMGVVGTTELAAAVVGAGGMGMVPGGVEPAPGACGVNLLMPFNPSLDMIAEAASKARVVEFFYADPQRDVVEAVHEEGALAGWQVGSAEEARAAEECGCDYVVAQGVEAGGHVRGTQPLEQVLAQTLGMVRVPVVAAGGVATAERFEELITGGADAVRVGTRFVASPESGAHPDYVRALLAAGGGDTVLTEWFGEGWEHAPHRVLRASLEAAERSDWRRPYPPNEAVDRDAGDMAMYAGMGVGDIVASEPAAVVVADLVSML